MNIIFTTMVKLFKLKVSFKYTICLGLYAFHILAYGWHSLRRPQRGLIGTYWTAQYSTNIDIANARVKRYSLGNRKK